MMKIAILNFNGALGSGVSVSYDILNNTGLIVKAFDGLKTKTNFEVDIVNSIEMGKQIPGSVFGIKSIAGKKVYDLVIIPSMGIVDIEIILKKQSHLIKWIKWQQKKGSGIASLCSGTFLLAASGLLDGKRATTNWMTASLFKKLFPLVKLQDDKVIVDEGNIYSCGAGFSSISFIVYLIEKFAGHDVAVAVSKVFMIQLHDIHENSISILNFQRDHGDNEIIIIQNYIEKNYNKGLKINELADKFNMSNRMFIRRFKQATGNTPLEYIQRVKIEAAKKMLEKGKDSIRQICSKAGYEEMNFFRTVFKRYTGISPQAYRKKFRNLLTEQQ